MDIDELRNWLVDNRFTAYELNKHTGVSLQSLQDFLSNTRKPQRKTLLKIEEFVSKKHTNLYQEQPILENTVLEDEAVYNKKATNDDILNTLNIIGSALVSNSEAVTNLLIKTYDNTSEILSYTKNLEIGIKKLEKLTLKALNK